MIIKSRLTLVSFAIVYSSLQTMHPLFLTPRADHSHHFILVHHSIYPRSPDRSEQCLGITLTSVWRRPPTLTPALPLYPSGFNGGWRKISAGSSPSSPVGWTLHTHPAIFSRDDGNRGVGQCPYEAPCTPLLSYPHPP